ncbi:folate-binding protein YgfZ [Microlunatus sp. Gsoil 973]|uniref:CAF17-like 4Fe-4S cluster assembly/insertion protein YgfZ n=1 Tax=Microlunatus sp. Gsoil 973 TaxID=2672569 RepID=UPI0012B47E97|nr:folate-binding protein YgfZ [Microlunatus sp. Gsoil 973]QGN33774.1 folate-binding protein [Microlunatus sp. Gsoil 973]
MTTAVIADTGPDQGVAWHYGDPSREQREIDAGRGIVDLSHHGVLTVTGPDRLSWLHSLTTQQLTDLAPGSGTTALILSGSQGHVEHVLYAVDDGETFWAHTEPGGVEALVGFLDRMRFMLRVEVADRTADFGILWTTDDSLVDHPARSYADSLGGRDLFVPRSDIAAVLASGSPAGTWAYEARRIAAGVPRIGVDTDHRTIPNEIGVLGGAVHLNKGCYPGQETVGRVQALGRPPRRLVRLHLDGSAEALPEVGAPILLDGRPVGRMGSSARHWEDGPIGLGLVKRNVPVDAEFTVSGIAAAQEVIVDPEIGDHFRAPIRSQPA